MRVRPLLTIGRCRRTRYEVCGSQCEPPGRAIIQSAGVGQRWKQVREPVPKRCIFGTAVGHEGRSVLVPKLSDATVFETLAAFRSWGLSSAAPPLLQRSGPKA